MGHARSFCNLPNLAWLFTPLDKTVGAHPPDFNAAQGYDRHWSMKLSDSCLPLGVPKHVDSESPAAADCCLADTDSFMKPCHLRSTL